MSDNIVQAGKKHLIVIVLAFAAIYIIWGTTYLGLAIDNGAVLWFFRLENTTDMAAFAGTKTLVEQEAVCLIRQKASGGAGGNGIRMIFLENFLIIFKNILY